MEVLRKICRAIVKPLCHLAALIVYRVRVEGIENVPKDSACIVGGNHVHALDAPALVAVTNRKILEALTRKDDFCSGLYDELVRMYKQYVDFVNSI